MNVVAHAVSPRAVASGRVAEVQVLVDVAEAEAVWRALEREGAVFTPYQRYEWVALWQHHVGKLTGTTPFIVVGRDSAGQPLFLWPLALSRRGPVRVASFFCGKHSNFNFALWRRDYAAELDAGELSALLKRLAALPPRVDVLMLLNQPMEWEGLRNPFALLPHQSSPSAAHRLQLGARGDEVLARQFSSSMRGRLRGKERHLQKLAGYRFYRAESAAEANRLLDSFFAQKAMRFDAQGIRNVFAEPGMEDFIRDCCHTGLADGRPVLELYAIEGDGEVLALRAGIADGRRFSCLFNSFSQGPHSRHSPGLILTAKVIGDCADRGFEYFDLGVGDVSYKTIFCNERESLIDSFLPLTPMGQLAAGAARLAYAAKSGIKGSPRLWAAVQSCRHFVLAKHRGS